MSEKELPPHPSASHLLQAVIDSMPDSIALLDTDGTIRMVNRAWREFADENQLRSASYCVGSNYIETCSSADGMFADDAHDVAVMLRDLASGQRQEIELEYTCHSPSEKRWFRTRATRLHDALPMLIVTHRRVWKAVRNKGDVVQRFDDLSPRELDVLRLLVQGLSTKQVAGRLQIGARTAEKHRQAIMRKTQAANIAELVLMVAAGDIVPLSLPESIDGQ